MIVVTHVTAYPGPEAALISPQGPAQVVDYLSGETFQTGIGENDSYTLGKQGAPTITAQKQKDHIQTSRHQVHNI